MEEKGYFKYINDVRNGTILACDLIKKSIDRFESFSNRDDIYFDEEEVDRCIAFIGQMKHFLGKSAGKFFILEPWQQFVIANIIGLKWVATNKRVCRETYIQIARKAGKDALLAAISLYLLIADGEASPEVIIAANSTDQARICFKYITQFGKSLDPNGKILKYRRNYIELPVNAGMCQVISSDASKGDGKNISCFVLDEYHEARDRQMYDVLRSSQGMREQPLAIIITTAGYNLDGPCHDMYSLSIEVLNNVKSMDNFFPFIWQLDDGDDWTDENNFIKCQPNLGITVTKEYMIEEVQKARNDNTAEVGVKIKTFNMWCQSSTVWLKAEQVVKCMAPIDLNDYNGYTAYCGVDLSSSNDLTALSVVIPYGDKFVIKAWGFIPEETYKEHPNRELYRKFEKEGDLIITQGNIVDYDYVTNKIAELSQILRIDGVFYDPYQATQWAITMTSLGYNMQPCSQGLLNFTAPTKTFETWILGEKAVIDRSSMFVWCCNNVVLKEDWNGNRKPMKAGASGAMSNQKIDLVIATLMATKGYIGNPLGDDFEITSVW